MSEYTFYLTLTVCVLAFVAFIYLIDNIMKDRAYRREQLELLNLFKDLANQTRSTARRTGELERREEAAEDEG